MEIITEFREILSDYATWNSTKFRGILGNLVENTGETEVHKHINFSVDGIPWTSYFVVK